MNTKDSIEGIIEAMRSASPQCAGFADRLQSALHQREAVEWEWGFAGSNSWVRCDEETYRHVLKTGFFGNGSPPCVARALYTTTPPSALVGDVVGALRKIQKRATAHADDNDADHKRDLYLIRATATAALAAFDAASKGEGHGR